VNVNFWLIQAFNGISYGALLFLVGSGLSLIFGVMRIVNLSHGSYFLLGGYVALTVIWTTGSWALSIPLAALVIAAVGIVMERAFLRPRDFDPLRQVLLTVGCAYLFQQAALDIGNHFGVQPPASLQQSVRVGGLDVRLYRILMIAIAAAIALALWLAMERTRIGAKVRATIGDGEMARGVGNDPLRQVLLTVGFAFLFQQAALDIWTGNNFDINPPDALTKSIVVGGLYLPLYRIFMIATALIIGVALWLAMEKTRMGAAVRATVDDAQMARGVGIDTSRISMLIFALGAFLAALGGVIGGAFLGIYPGLDFEMLPIAFAVVIIGGMGSLGGAAIGALVVGLADNFGKALFPEISYFTLYAPMALILAVKPTGLFGRE
jgi:branched-chain amino acid transport system permease protein